MADGYRPSSSARTPPEHSIVTVDAVHPRFLSKSKLACKLNSSSFPSLSDGEGPFCLTCTAHVDDSVQSLRDHFNKRPHGSHPCIYCGGASYKYVYKSEKMFHGCVRNITCEDYEVLYCPSCDRDIENNVTALEDHFSDHSHENEVCEVCHAPAYKYIVISEKIFHECNSNVLPVYRENSNTDDTSIVSEMSDDQDNDIHEVMCEAEANATNDSKTPQAHIQNLTSNEMQYFI